MDITYRKASHKDIDTLIKLRLDYLTEDRGALGKEETEALVRQLEHYFPQHLNSSFIAFLAEKMVRQFQLFIWRLRKCRQTQPS